MIQSPRNIIIIVWAISNSIWSILKCSRNLIHGWVKWFCIHRMTDNLKTIRFHSVTRINELHCNWTVLAMASIFKIWDALSCKGSERLILSWKDSVHMTTFHTGFLSVYAGWLMSRYQHIIIAVIHLCKITKNENKKNKRNLCTFVFCAK